MGWGEMGSKRITDLRDDTISEVNEARKLVNLGPIQEKVRACLRCGDKFKSLSAGNRMCTRCLNNTSNHDND